MRLVVFGGPWSVWSRLEPETAEERMVIEACLARGEPISGSGVEAIPTLRALAARVGSPIETLDPRVTASPSPRLVVVRRDEATLHARLAALTREGLTVIWDRRNGGIVQSAPMPTYRVASDAPAELTENCGVSERVNRYSGTHGMALGPARRRLEALARARRDDSRRRYSTLAEGNRARQRAYRARRRGPTA